jgi:SPOR domain
VRATKSFIFLLAIAFGGEPCWGSPVADAIAQGDFATAGQVLDSLVNASAIGRAEQAYWEGILAESAEKSSRFLEDALGLGLEPNLSEIAIQRLAEYALLVGDSLQTVDALAENAPDAAALIGQPTRRIQATLFERDQHVDSSLKLIDAGLVKSRGTDMAQWWNIDKARALILSGKPVGATKALITLSKMSKGEGVPIALYLLARESLAKRETEKAAHYFNLLRDGFPDAVGSDELVDRLSEIEEPTVSESRAEKITGTYYSVQVGVFSNPENAERGSEMYRKYKMPVEVVKKRISNVMYNVVFVGHFSEYHEALRAKTMLEANHNEHFQVVAR